MTDDTVPTPSPWHPGEVALQRERGVSERMAVIGRKVLRPFLTEEHRAFYPLLPFVVLGAVDPQGAPWATLRAGHPGFLHSPDPSELALEVRRDPQDPADAGLGDGDAVGLLGIDLTTRRRNRLNGTVRRQGDAAFSIAVVQGFGNCPRYIQARTPAFSRDPSQLPATTPVVSDHLDATARRMIREADTFFVASYADVPGGERQVDVSHRGGKPGFVRTDPGGGLTVPDFSGNMFFNTLGNFAINPRAGLVFMTPETGDLLQITGRVSFVDDPRALARFEGAERLWKLHPEQVVRRPAALPIRWSPGADHLSPFSLRTGDWGTG
ncbi:flavin-nucleotide-binding protein (plasmid) [Paroceanicella profunda]|uniref:Flavin-nucleotide-binding protein n=1 Tax=Paroceanicella profunda TaxID=2579971 RepID=A0A5B8G2H9_9RHOB|nr:pyridoxamine 5'-phosphate oxidase family protein [Paroceanicella profunda]QDL94110.1 flavin-nucleotide-binding protein [Paroceanicella profunda]